jgi:hypothetical protein
MVAAKNSRKRRAARSPAGGDQRWHGAGRMRADGARVGVEYDGEPRGIDRRGPGCGRLPTAAGASRGSGGLSCGDGHATQIRALGAARHQLLPGTVPCDRPRPGSPPKARSSVSRQEGSPDRWPGAAATPQRVLAADGGMRSVSGSTSNPIPPPVSTASCSRRAAMRSVAAPSTTRAAPATPGERNASSNARSPSFGRFASTRISSAGDRPKSRMPAGQMSGSDPIQGSPHGVSKIVRQQSFLVGKTFRVGSRRVCTPGIPGIHRQRPKRGAISGFVTL